MGEGSHKVFLWTSGNRFKSDVAKTVKIIPFPLATGTFVFLVLEGIMKSKVFVKKQHTLSKQRSPVCLNRRRGRSGEDVISKKFD